MKRFSTLLLFLIMALSFVYAQEKQELHSNSGRAKKFYKKGTSALINGNYKEAKENLESAIKIDDQFIEAHLVLGETFEYLKEPVQAKDEYYKVLAINKNFFPSTYFTLGHLEVDGGNYEKGKINFQNYLTSKEKDITMADESEFMIKLCDFAMNAVKNPIPFEPKNLGENINTEHAEYLPALTADENVFIFTKRLPWEGSDYQFQEDFYVSFKQDGLWMPATPIGKPINTNKNEGAQCLSPDGQYIFFTACNRDDGFGRCDIYVSRLKGNSWGIPVNIGKPINTSKWESQPSISSDGMAIYYSSNRNGSYGKNTEDIWKSDLLESGEWGPPENMGPKINTSQSEQSPFIHPDNQTLYFSSDGHLGMGRFDIYVCRKDENGEWGQPENLGYPINTSGNENSLIVSLDGKYAYFASSREDGFGDMDIYTFELHEKARPKTVTYVKGLVYDIKNKKNLFARFEFIDLATGEKVIESHSNELSGDFLVCLPANKDYALNVSKDGYLFYSESYFLKQKDKFEPIFMDIPLTRIEVGEKVILKNIFFETGKYILKPESKAELNKVVEFLNSNANIKVEIGGHTDNVGNDEDNMLLSDYRAHAVLEYLFEKKINPSRLIAKGYGETQPIADNETDEGRALNRRTEFMIVERRE